VKSISPRRQGILFFILLTFWPSTNLNADAFDITLVPAGQEGIVFWLGRTGMANVIVELKETTGQSIGYVSVADITVAGILLPEGIRKFYEISGQTQNAIGEGLAAEKIPFYTRLSEAIMRIRPFSLKTGQSLTTKYIIGASSTPTLLPHFSADMGRIATVKKITKDSKLPKCETIGWTNTFDLLKSGLLRKGLDEQDLSQLTYFQSLEFGRHLETGKVPLYENQKDASSGQNGKFIKACGAIIEEEFLTKAIW
jgi:hypothetical protein